jgi:hypothetical protein
MKRDLSQLTHKHIDAIKHWLKLSIRDEQCPFYHCVPSCMACDGIFPHGVNSICPCHQYSVKYVAKVARQVIKQWESNLPPSPGTGEKLGQR